MVLFLRIKTFKETLANSNQLEVSGFPTSTATTETKPTEAMKIPAFLDCTLTAKQIRYCMTI
jgi:hypothetical protein